MKILTYPSETVSDGNLIEQGVYLLLWPCCSQLARIDKFGLFVCAAISQDLSENRKRASAAKTT